MEPTTPVEEEEGHKLVNVFEDATGILDLKKVSESIDLPPSREDQELMVDLLQYVIDHDGLGMAAVQLGENKRIFVFEKPAGTGNLQVVVNPVIHSMSGNRKRIESCFSFPNVRVMMQRPADIVVSYHDEHGELVANESLSGNTGQVFLHEYSHLDGITLMDKSKFGNPLGTV